MNVYVNKQYPALNDTNIELTKYMIRDMLDNLQEIYESEAQEFIFVYFNF